jgi:hypothetical protein
MEWSCSTNKGGTKRPIEELRSDTMTSRVNERGFARCDVLIRADADDHGWLAMRCANFIGLRASTRV